MRKVILAALGILISILPVAICILTYFPLWRERGDGALLSGFAVFLLLISLLPLSRLLRRLLRSPSIHRLWFIAFVIFFIASRIADEMTVICFVGFVSNLIGAILFRYSGVKLGCNENEA